MAPNFDPTEWFLDDRKNPDAHISLSSPNNQVEALIDGQSYMEKLYNLLSTAGAGDFFYYVGFELNLDLKLVPSKAASTVRNLFTAARRNKVDIRVLLSNHIGNNNNKAAREFGALRPDPIECILDSRFADWGTAHQKFSILFTDRANGTADQRLTEKRLFAFCGGIDLDLDRYDDGTHSNHNRQPAQIRDFSGGWHDVHTFIQGSACIDLLFMFQERWNNPAPTRKNESRTYTPITQTVSPSATPPAGKHLVQVLRTYSCGWNNMVVSTAPPPTPVPIVYPVHVDYPFARQGEYSARNACIKAISKAQDFIYIEDQYFFSYEIAAALRDAMVANESLLVIVLVAQEPTADKGTEYENFYHAKTVEGLVNSLKAQKRDLEKNFAIYDLVNEDEVQIYVHAKLMIIDDIWVQIGSMNCNRRSTTHDLEAAIAVIDDELDTVDYHNSYGRKVCRFAHKLRLQLWSEHLGLSNDLEIQDPQIGFFKWAEVASIRGLAHARHHVPALNRTESAMIWDNIGDPQGTCPGVKFIPDPWPQE